MNATKLTLKKNTSIDKKLKNKLSIILKNFATVCSIPTKNFATIHQTIHQEKSFLRPESPSEDTISYIPKTALSRLLDDDTSNLFNTIDRYLFFMEEGFLIATFNVEQLINNSNLDSYDNMKYNTLYSSYPDSFINTKPNPNIPLIWIELICVDPKYRKKGITKLLLNNLEKKITDIYKDNTNVEYVILGLDIAGTTNGWRNKNLRDVYSKLGFNFENDGFYIYTEGGQIGFKEIDLVR